MSVSGATLISVERLYAVPTMCMQEAVKNRLDSKSHVVQHGDFAAHGSKVRRERGEMATQTNGAAPRRTRAATPKPAAEKAAPAKTEAPAATGEPLKVELQHVTTTKTYERFEFDPALRGTLTGSVYAPLGTARVGVVIFPGEAPAE